MTTFTVNGVAYNDLDYSGANLFGMGNGGFRVNWAPMMNDALTDFSGKVAACAASAASALAAPGTSATSTTSVTVGTGSQAFTLAQTGKLFSLGQAVCLARTSAPGTRMVGVITAFNSGTGAITVNRTSSFGSGTFTDWTLSLSPLARQVRQFSSITTSSTPTPNADTDDVFAVTALAGAATFGAPTGTPIDGQALMFRVKDNGTARALAYNSVFRASSDLALPATTILSKTLYIGFNYNAVDTKWDLVAVLNNFT